MSALLSQAFVGTLVAATAAVLLAAGVLATRDVDRAPAGRRWLLVLLGSLALWSAAYALQILAPTVPAKLFWARFVATGTVLAAAAWFLFVVAYIGSGRYLGGWRTAAVLAIPAASVPIAWTNQLHGLIWAEPGTVAAAGTTFLSTTKGPWFVLIAAYLYLLILVSLGLLASLFLSARSLQRGQAGTLLVAGSVPLVGNVVYWLVGRAYLPVDVTPLLLTLTALLVVVAVTRYRLLDVLPVTQHDLLEALDDAVVVVDDDGRVLSLNAAARSLFPEATVGDRFGTLLPDGGAAPDVVGTEVQLKRAGERQYYDLRRSRVRPTGDDRRGEMLVFRDITQRKRREQSLAEYKTVFETISDKVYVLDDDGLVRLANEPLAAMLGTTPDEMVGQPATSFIPADAFERGTEVIADLMASEQAHGTVELVLADAEGREIPCETYISLLPYDESYSGVVGVIRDVSERKAAESELRRTSDTLESIFEAAPLAIVTVDAAGRVDRWNQGATELFGWSAETVSDRPLTDLFGATAVADLADDVLSGARVTGREFGVTDSAGAHVDVRVAGAPLPRAGGGSVLLFADVSARIQREQQVAVLNRVLRHNLRNDMTVILGQLELLRGDLASEDHREAVDMALEHGRDLLDLSEKAREAEGALDRTTERRTRQVGSLLEPAIDSLRERFPAADVQVGEVPAAAVVVRESIDVAIDALLENAVEHNDSDHPRVEISATIRETDVTIRIVDDGPGIPDAELGVLTGRTETPLQHGSGLGLWLVHWVIRRSGGGVAVDTDPARGTTVTVTLPRADAAGAGPGALDP